MAETVAEKAAQSVTESLRESRGDDGAIEAHLEPDGEEFDELGCEGSHQSRRFTADS